MAHYGVGAALAHIKTCGVNMDVQNLQSLLTALGFNRGYRDLGMPVLVAVDQSINVAQEDLSQQRPKGFW